MSAIDSLQSRLDATQAHLAMISTELDALAKKGEPVPIEQLQGLIKLAGFTPEAADLAYQSKMLKVLARRWPQYTRDMVSRGKVHDWLLEQAQHAEAQIERLPGGWQKA